MYYVLCIMYYVLCIMYYVLSINQSINQSIDSPLTYQFPNKYIKDLYRPRNDPGPEMIPKLDPK